MPARVQDQILATTAAGEVDQLAQRAENLEELRKLPAHVQASGLGQTIAFYLKKNPRVAEALVRGLQVGRQQQTDALQYLRHLMGQATAAEYRKATRQALAYASWLKRFAEAALQ
jgi:CRISPR type III-B/RAMP module-associated protein Cmr5